MDQALIAPCGMNCGICSRYLALKKDVRSHGIRVAYCAGCRARARQCAYIRKNCRPIHSRQIQYCYECAEFPCRNLSKLDKRYRTYFRMSMVENLRYIKENGIEKFLNREKAKWQCPECGGVVSCHNGICFSCGLDLLKNKRNLNRWED